MRAVVTGVPTESFITVMSQNFIDLPADGPRPLACFLNSTDSAKA